MLLAIVATLMGVPVLVLLIEVISSLQPPKEEGFERSESRSRARLAVIIPAHNEGQGIVPTLRDIKPQLAPGDRLIVVADNCNDNTAEMALAEGAEVTRRNEPDRIGKGYAMGWGISQLAADPPALVLFVDADCQVGSDLVGRMKTVCEAIGRPVQALYLMHGPDGGTANRSFAEFAWILKNKVRPLGLRNLHCPVQLMGTGMMFPWQVISSAQLASSDLVEDMKLGLDLATAGWPPYFFPFASVTSEFPATASGAETQRQRWVRGHLGTISNYVPRLIWLGVRRRNLHVVALALDLLVPPLSLLGLLVAGFFAVACLGALLGLGVTAMFISAANLVALFLSLVLAWIAFGRQVLPRSTLLSVGPFAFQKLGFYGRLISGKAASHWLRTDRAKLDRMPPD